MLQVYKLMLSLSTNVKPKSYIVIWRLLCTEHQNDKDEETRLISATKGGRGILHCDFTVGEDEAQNLNWTRDRGQIPKKAFSQEVILNF